MALPNFLIVGAAKSGTTSLYEYLVQHPDIYLSPVKEPCYFCDGPPHVAKTDQEYEQLFSGRTIERAIGEASASYLSAPEAPARIRRLLGQIRIIVLLRNPADRAHSAWNQLRNIGYEDLSFEEALQAEPERMRSRAFFDKVPFNHDAFYYFHCGLYAEQLQRYLDTFGQDHVQIHIFEEFTREAGRCCRRIFEFLQVDPDFEPTLERHNAAHTYRRGRLHRFLLNPPGWMEKTYQALPMRLRMPIYRMGKAVYWWNQSPAKRVPLDPQMRARLAERYREDITRLEHMLGRDLSRWYPQPSAQSTPTP